MSFVAESQERGIDHRLLGGLMNGQKFRERFELFDSLGARLAQNCREPLPNILVLCENQFTDLVLGGCHVDLLDAL
jgi:hypothetical protein